MKTFSTITGAFNYVKKHLNTGEELTINDTLHFGVGSSVYAYAEDVNLALGTPINGAFTHLNTDDEIKRLISHTFQVNGFLIVQ